MKQLYTIIILSFLSHLLTGQSVGIGTASPQASAALDVSSVTQGMLVPRMTTAQRTMISNPATGLLVFDMSTNSFWFKGGSMWVELIDSSKNIIHSNGANVYMAMSGNLGIGTNTPTTKLEVRTPPASLGITHNDGTIKISSLTTALAGMLGTTTNHPLQLMANSVPNQLTLMPSGNIGIGTATPNHPLSFPNTLGNKISLSGTAGNNFGFGLGAGMMQVFADASTSNIGFGYGQSPSFTEVMRMTGTGRFGIGTTAPTGMIEVVRGTAPEGNIFLRGTTNNTYFNQSTNEHTTINGGKNGSNILLNPAAGTGNVGIGTASPLQKLDVNGNVYINGNVGIGVSVPTGSIEVVRGTGIGGTAIFKGTNHNSVFNFSTDEHTYIRGGKPGSHIIMNDIPGLGNVGVGTATPSQKLHVQGNVFITDKLGIGTNTPNAALQLANTALNRRIVLWENTNNDHQFNGFGGDASTMRYQVGNTASNHIFYAGISAGSSTELMRITGQGNVGIGVNSPTASLEVARGTGINGTAAFLGTQNNSVINFGTEEDTYIRGGKAGANLYLNDVGGLGNVGIGSTGIPLQKLHVQGKVFIADKLGIGVSDPTAYLQLPNTEENRKIVLYDGANNEHQFNGLGGQQTEMRYQVSDINYDHVFYAATSSTESDELMRVKGNGDVEIAGNANVAGSLDIGYIVGSVAYDVPPFTTSFYYCGCPAGTKVLGGGWAGDNVVVTQSKPPDTSGAAWSVRATNSLPAPSPLAVWAICARVGN